MAPRPRTGRPRCGKADGILSSALMRPTALRSQIGAREKRTFEAEHGARIQTAWLVFLGSGALLATLLALLVWNPSRPAGGKDALIVYCAAGIKAPVEAVAREYETLRGVPIQLQYGGSQT